MLAVLALLATWNLQAASSERKRARLAADRVDAVAVSVGGDVNAHAFTLSFVITNNGDHTLRIGEPRVEPPLFELTEALRQPSVVSGDSTQVSLRLKSRCPVPSTVKIRAVLPVSPPSGRVVDLPVEPDVSLVEGLARRSCGAFSAEEAVVAAVRGVTSTQYDVQFSMLLTNGSDQPFVLLDLTSPGLALSVQGGVPLAVSPNGNVDLAVTVALPACSRLPAPGPSGGALPEQFGTIILELRDDNDTRQAKRYYPRPDLLRELLGLRDRICPGATFKRPRVGS